MLCDVFRTKKTMSDLLEENARLSKRVQELEAEIERLKNNHKPADTPPPPQRQPFQKVARLNNAEIARYGRQLILPGFGIKGQFALRNTSILIVGAGGLGAPAALYLGAAGVGRLGIVDHDTVDVSNLHRQVIHNEARVGINKAVSAKMTVEAINQYCQVIAYDLLLDSSNARNIIDQHEIVLSNYRYDIVIDATDNVATRYLLNDACVLGGKPLVSGSALRMDGQLTVYNYQGGPCYRCLYPNPPPPETVTNCSDGGVMGVGTLQALEAIKIAAGIKGSVLSADTPTLFLLSADRTPPFRSVRLRARKNDCVVCGETPTIKELIDYVEFCGAAAVDKSYATLRASGIPHLLLDVREPVQYDICALEGSVLVPLKELDRRVDEVKKKVQEAGGNVIVEVMTPTFSCHETPVYVVCRLGNDSQVAVHILQHHGLGGAKDIVGGLYRWSRDVDPEFPIY
ncbi:Molybdopterin-synthase sulfurtransferase [Endogone sp. FLAS-F59071]|nr:Molybdopterin-synthase sulfurtransferase [Endogone sp. FLAS-F59071]|eukprot:RUS19125.1 Molybdopterin-synthase sulfurtransferase [Endogone sp. FLAS-F59071]